MRHNLDSDEVRSHITVGEVLTRYGARMRGKGRADCPHCKGSSIATLGFNDRVGHCFRCGWKGDAFALVMAMSKCSFPEALQEVARMAGMTGGADAITAGELRRRRQERDRVQGAAEKLVRAEDRLRQRYARYNRTIHYARRLAGVRLRAVCCRGQAERFTGEATVCEQLLATVPMLERRVIAAFAILAYGSARQRAEFILRPDTRAAAVAEVLQSGTVVDGDSRPVEVWLG